MEAYLSNGDSLIRAQQKDRAIELVTTCFDSNSDDMQGVLLTLKKIDAEFKLEVVAMNIDFKEMIVLLANALNSFMEEATPDVVTIQ